MTLKAVPGQVSSGPGWTWSAPGGVEITGAGAVLSGLYIAGYGIDVKANNVTIKDVRVVASGLNGVGISLRHASNVTIEDSSISGQNAGPGRLMAGVKDYYGDCSGTSILRDNIWYTATGVQVQAGLIQDSYIHDDGYRQGDHVNGITSNGGAALLAIRHNTILIDRSETDAIGLFEDFGVQANRDIEDNLLAGGGYIIYGGQNRSWPTSNIVIKNNRFSRIYYQQGGLWGDVAYFAAGERGNLWSGNYWTGNTVAEVTGAIADP